MGLSEALLDWTIKHFDERSFILRYALNLPKF